MASEYSGAQNLPSGPHNSRLRKVLFITYYWPPAGGPTVQRILKFAEYLPEFGWQPVVVTTAVGDFPIVDDSLAAELSPDIRVYHTKTFSLYNLYGKMSGKKGGKVVPYDFTFKGNRSLLQKISRLIKFNMIPDSRISWYFYAKKLALQIAEHEQVDLIFSTSPPQTAHLIARSVSRNRHLPWIADFRDPWTDVFWLKETGRIGIIQKLDRFLEKKALQQANALTTVSPSLIRLFEGKTDKPVYLIYNGYDERYYRDLQLKKPDKFTINYGGSLSAEQPVTPFLEALQKFIHESPKAEPEVNFFGNFANTLLEEIQAHGLSGLIRFHGFIPHREMVQRNANAGLLLLIVPDTPDNKGILTSKIFDYLRTGKPILCFGPPDGDIAAIFNETGRGRLVAYGDVEAALDYIRSSYEAWKKSPASGPLPDNGCVSRFDRRNLTRQLAQVFDRHTER